MDIIYPYKKSNDELIYSLRSLVNIPHERVFIVGDRPADINLNKINYIPFKQENNSTNTKYKNTTEILKYVCRNTDISENFILFNDDFFILRPIVNAENAENADIEKELEKELNLYRGKALKVYEHYTQKFGINGYANGMLETIKLLQKMGISEPLSYELHIPFIFNKNKFLAMFEISGVNDIKALHKRTLYGNLYLKNSVSVKDVKVFVCGNTDIAKIAKEQKFLSCTDTAWFNLRPKLQKIKIFNKKSIYEL